MEIGRRGATILSFGVVAARLDVNDFATFIMIATAYGLLTSAAQVSIDRVLIRLWVTDPETALALARTSVWMCTSGAILGVLACSAFGTTGLGLLVGFFGLRVVGQCAAWTCETRARAAADLVLSNKVRSASDLLPALAVTVAAVLTGDLLAVVVAGGVASLPLLVIGRHALNLPSRSQFKAALAVGSTAGFTGLLSVAYWRIDVFLLGAMASASAVASYGIATRLLDIALLVPSIYGQLTIAAFVQEGDKVSWAWGVGRRLIRIGAAISVLVALLAVPLSALITLVLNKSVDPLVLALLFSVLPTAYFGGIIGNYLFANQQEKLFVHALVGMIVVNIILNCGAIPLFGATGAAGVTAVTELFGVGWMYYKLRHTRVGHQLGRRRWAS